MSMSNQIQFEGENGQGTFRSRDIFGAPTTPKMISFMIKKGIAKEYAYWYGCFFCGACGDYNDSFCLGI